MHKFYIFLLLAAISSTSNAQTYSHKTVGMSKLPGARTSSDAPYTVIRSSDGGLVFAYQYVRTGKKNGVVKFNNLYAVEWSRGTYIYDTENNYPSALVEALDGGFIVVGTYSYATDSTGGFVYKYNKSGTILWQKFFKGATFTSFSSIAQDQLGNLFISGKSNDGTTSNPAIVILNRKGDVVFNAVYNGGGNILEAKVINTRDKGFAILARTNTTLEVIKANRTGLVTWAKSIAGQFLPYNMDIVEGSTKAITVVASQTDGSALAFQLSKRGVPVWGKKLTNTSNVVINDAAPALSGSNNILVAATVGSAANLFKLNFADGSVIASKDIYSTAGSVVNSISRISANEYMIAGFDASASTNYVSTANFDTSLVNCNDVASTYTVADNPVTTLDIALTTSSISEMTVTPTGEPYSLISQVATVCEEVLPLNLIRFAYTKSGNNVVLSWSTTTEINASYFDVERSADARSFAPIGKVTAKNTTNQNNYQFTDARPLSGVNYYRLKMVDADGKFKYSPYISTANNKQVDYAIFPNPIQNNIFLTINSKVQTAMTVTVTDMQGRAVLRTVFNINEGVTTKDIPAASLAKGTYIVKLESSEGTQVIKIVK